MKKSEALIAELITPTVEALGLELWGIESRKRAVRKTLKRRLSIFVNGHPYLTDFATEHPPESPVAG